MYSAMGFFWLAPLAVMGFLIWLLISLLKDASGKHEK